MKSLFKTIWDVIFVIFAMCLFLLLGTIAIGLMFILKFVGIALVVGFIVAGLIGLAWQEAKET